MGPHIGARVLLAEDHPMNQEVLEYMLDQIGCQVTVVADGRAALQTLGAERYDVVLMDCNMPTLDGFEATTDLRKREAESGQRVPIVALTADGLDSTRERCMAVGMDDYLRKPVNAKMLRTVIQRWVPVTDEHDSDSRRPGCKPTAAVVSGDSHGRSQAADASEIDSTVVSVLRAAGDDFMSSLVSKYAENWARDIDRLRNGMERDDAESVRAIAHRLRSSSASLGASLVATRCHTVELAAGEGRLEAIDGIVGRLEADHARALRGFAAN